MATDGYHVARVLGWSLDQRETREGPMQYVAVDLEVGGEILQAQLGLDETMVP